jgi:hypothetical protein
MRVKHYAYVLAAGSICCWQFLRNKAKEKLDHVQIALQALCMLLVTVLSYTTGRMWGKTIETYIETAERASSGGRGREKSRYGKESRESREHRGNLSK